MRIISRKALNEFAAESTSELCSLTRNMTKGRGRSEAVIAGDLERLEQAWLNLAPWLTVPRTEAEYRRLVELLNALIDRVGEEESHPLAGLMDLVGELIAHYEDAHVPELA